MLGRPVLGRRALGMGLATLAMPAVLRAQAGAAQAARPPDLGPYAIRLTWIRNAQFAGEYFADSRGYYRDEGFSAVDLQSGGPGAPPTEIDLSQGKCLIGISAIDLTAAAIAQGAGLRTIGCLFQKSAFCLLSLAGRPIEGPKAMIGKRIGVQGGNQVIFATFLQLNGIDPDRVTTVPVQFDPTPLVAGEVDGWVGYIANEPNQLKRRGIAATSFLFADHNYPLLMETYVVRADSALHDRERLKAALRAELRGWKDNLRDPVGGAALALDRYGQRLGLNRDSEIMQSRTENTLITSPETEANGLFTLTPERMERNVKVLRDLGNEVSQESLFDMSLLAEIYHEDPTLIRV
ncbi:ABC transporter substrate-binding protein [Lichenicoccus sp.]|uniref:ABC transporter substrate-binding protein n=1 Tax=Lichenicoccus sp. TaxID=2781899 RepID=UPI003D1078BC